MLLSSGIGVAQSAPADRLVAQNVGSETGASGRTINKPPGARSDREGAPTPGSWQVGSRLPQEFRNNQFLVTNYKQFDLPPPKRGHRWVGIGADFLLVSSSNVIAEVRAPSPR
jgi:Ni/Co efflux regulator RcnB